MSYTLKLTSLQWPAERPEYREMTIQSADTLRINGWTVRILDVVPHRRDDGVMSSPRQEIQAIRQILFLRDLERYWGTKLIGFEAELIRVIFPNAHVSKRYDGMMLRHSPSGLEKFWYTSNCTVSNQVELFVNGGNQIGQDNLWQFLAVLNSWEKKFKVARKLGQLIGLATQKNDGAVERLRSEILEIVTLL